MFKGLWNWARGTGISAGKLAMKTGTKAKGLGARGMSWYEGLGDTAQGAILGAGVGGLTGAFGLNPFNAIPFLGDVDAGGGIGGAIAGAAAGAAFGKFGANKAYLGRGVDKAYDAYTFRLARSQLRGNQVSKFQRGMMAGLDRASLVSNKHGDKILAGLAAGSAGLIGGSILSTNRPY